MKLFRYGQAGQELPGITGDDNIHYDVSGFGEDYTGRFFETNGLNRLAQWVAENPSALKKVEADQRFGPPVTGVSKIICVGLNFRDHALESRMDIPTEPVLFFKSTTAICGPNDDVIIPRDSVKTDWEVELAVVIGRRASYIEEADAANYIAGYMLHNDYSEREFQLERNGQWVKGKSCDTFAPMGPYMVPADEIADVHDLPMWLKVNGQQMQNGNTREMIYKVPFLIAYISRFMTLLPGDIISTGTPAGVGLAQKPQPVYLKPGDRVELGINGLGQSQQQLVAWQHPG